MEVRRSNEIRRLAASLARLPGQFIVGYQTDQFPRPDGAAPSTSSGAAGSTAHQIWLANCSSGLADVRHLWRKLLPASVLRPPGGSRQREQKPTGAAQGQ